MEHIGFLQRYQGLIRYYKHKIHPDHKVLLFCNPHLHPFVADYVYASIDLPQWYYDLQFDTDCYETVPVNSPAGSLTPPEIYSRLISYFRQHYNMEKAVEVFPPRGCNFAVDRELQVFCRYQSEKILLDKPAIVVFPRTRVRASFRNVPAYVWFELVEKLREHFIVVLAGVPSGACLAEHEGENIVNLISYNGKDKTEKLITYLNSADLSISSQSGGTHISLLSGCPSYIIGHEQQRHAIDENRLNIPTSFRYTADYRAIDADTIISDVMGFRNQLLENGWILSDKPFKELIEEDSIKLQEIINAQR